MASNSFAYFGFLAAGTAVYHILPKRARKVLLLALSLLFYWIGAARFLWLLLATIGFSYALGRWIETAKAKKLPLILGLGMNLGTLALFKYLGFFGALASRALSLLGLAPLRLPTLALPLGISFFEFVCCGYLIDVYRGKRAAERNILDFSLFVSFFPAILSGPIERADHLLPQIKNLRSADGEDLKFAVTRLLCGLTKKVLLADTLAIIVNTAYAEPLQLRDRLLKTVWLRYALWAALLIAVAVFGAYGTGYNAQEFVYFQF